MKKETSIALFIGLLIGVGIGYLIWKKTESKGGLEPEQPGFVTATDDSTSFPNVRNGFRANQNQQLQEYGVWYEIDSVKRYMDNKITVLIDTIKNRNGGKLPNDCKMVLGFYWMRKNDNASNRKLSFYVIPTIYNTKSFKVYDYFDSTYYKYYHRPNETQPLTSGRGDSLAYDDGTMFP
jgi:hypothetical protein